MSESRKNIKHYTSEDIQKYLEESLSPAEMHAMEKAALDDPFLADAIEGIQQQPDTFGTDVTELRQRMDEKLNKRKNRSAINAYWKVAATIILTVTAVTIFIFTNEKSPREKKVLAKAEERFDSIIKVEKKDSSAMMPEPEQLPTPARQRSSKPATVVNDEGHEMTDSPAPSAMVLEAEKIAAIPTDSIEKTAAGNYSKVSKDLEGRAAGINVESEAGLEEVVVIGYSARKKQTRRFSGESVETRNSLQVIPAGGWKEFDNYLYRNTVKDSLSSGSEIISFTIDKNGRPKNYKIRKSLSPAHDAETIRLLENGPDWKIIEGKKRKVRLEIIF